MSIYKKIYKNFKFYTLLEKLTKTPKTLKIYFYILMKI